MLTSEPPQGVMPTARRRHSPSAPGLVQRAHASIIWLIARMPPRVGIQLFRVYNRALRAGRPLYRATTSFGARIYCDPHDLIQRMILHFGMWEPDVSRAIEAHLGPGDVFVDVGANIGYDSLLASTIVGPNGQVVAIEPAPQTFSLLQRNVVENDARNVRAIGVAVAPEPGRVGLYELSATNIGATSTLASRGGTLVASVDALPLEQLLTPEELARVRLIKMDIEGAEAPVLQVVLDNIGRYPSTMEIIVEASPADAPTLWPEVFAGMTAAGFVAYEIENSYEFAWYLAWRSPSPLHRITTLPADQRDLLFTRKRPQQVGS
jgi:FkbM family methyltransferase